MPQVSARDKALQAIDGIRREVDALEQQVCAPLDVLVLAEGQCMYTTSSLWSSHFYGTA